MSRMKSQQFTVGDLFCGAGGFAEGFEQAGFRVSWGVDNWHPAAETFQRNHPDATVLETDLLSLDTSDLERLGKVDVLIGSPPCTHFSAANRGGNGDRRAGMRLVRKFLTIVHALEPRYWVMENVPGLRRDLERIVRGGQVDFEGGPLSIPVMEILDASSYGVPQSRRRLFSGNFPMPAFSDTRSGGRFQRLGDMLGLLPDPREAADARRAAVRDPIYDGEKVPRALLRDHFEDTRWALTQDEVASSVRDRETHRIYGKMPFPDSLDRPCRTITATRTRGSRSTIVIPMPDRDGVPYRTLTLRECASAQGFPLSYQFWATSMSHKDALVGNAVPPPVARAIASAILLKEGRDAPLRPAVKRVGVLPPLVGIRRLGPRRFSMTRRFRGIVPLDWSHEHRVELDNEFPKRSFPLEPTPSEGRSVYWKTRLYLGYATKYRCYDLGIDLAIEMVSRLFLQPRIDSLAESFNSALAPILDSCAGGFPDALSLQERWTGRRSDVPSPDALLRLLAHHVGRGMSKERWGEVYVPVGVTNAILRSACIAHGKEADSNQPLPMSIRLLVSTVALTFMCERLNNGNRRMRSLSDRLSSATGATAGPSENLPAVLSRRW